jgi:hypothetical protein
MRIERLTETEDLLRYRRGYREATGFDVTVERLSRYTAYGALSGEDLFAGFWIIEDPPYRALEFVPDGYIDGDAVIEEVLEQNLVEFGGLWKRRGSTPGWRRIQWFLVSCLRAVRHVPSDGMVVFGYDHNVDHLRRLYSHARTRVIYRGPMTLPTRGSEATEVHGSIECLTRGAFARATVSLILELTGQAARNLTRLPFAWFQRDSEPPDQPTERP